MENDAPPGETTPTPEERAAQAAAEAAAPEERAQPAPSPSPAEAAAAEAAAPEQPIAPGQDGPGAYQVYAAPPTSAPPYPPYQPYAAPRPPIAPERRTVPWWGWLIGGVLAVLLLTIIGCCALSGLAFGIFGRAFHGGGPEATETLSRTFAVSGAPTLVVHDPAGNVTVTPGSDGQVVVQATKRARDASDDAARRGLNSIRVDVSQDGNTITVEASFTGAAGFGADGDRTVDVDLTVPVASGLSVGLAAGNVTIRQIVGQMNVTATAGNIETRDVTFAGASHISATAGNVTLDGVMNSGSLLDARVGSGNITLQLPANISAHLDAQTDVGNVSVNGWPIVTSRQGVTGARAVGDLAPGPTDTITLRVRSGNITVGQR